MAVLKELKRLVDEQGVETVVQDLGKVLDKGADKAVDLLPREFQTLGAPVAALAKVYLKHGLEQLDHYLENKLEDKAADKEAS